MEVKLGDVAPRVIVTKDSAVAVPAVAAVAAVV